MKRTLSIILTMFMLLSATITAFATETEHEHKLMKMANAACHYEECTVCFELFNVGSHTFEDGECTVCGHDEWIPSEDEEKDVHEHIFNKTSDMETHYEECITCFERFGVGKHTFENGVCTVCRHKEFVNPFDDVKETAWYASDILAATDMGLVAGKTPELFKPDDFLTYAEALKLAACMNQYSREGKVTLANGSPWYKSYYDYCVEKGIVSKGEAFAFNENATRIGYIKIFEKALDEGRLPEINYVADNAIPDVKKRDDGAEAVYKFYRAGILAGVDLERTCNPLANIKRSEVATIISRMMNNEKRVRFTLGASDEGYNIADDKVIDSIDEAEHEHEYEMKFDEFFHWNECGECEEIANEEEHTFIDGVCDKCGYEKQEQEEKDDILVLDRENDSSEDENPADTYLNPTHSSNYTKPVIEKQPESFVADEYGIKYEAEVVVTGGEEPYCYQWYYYTGYRNETAKIENGDYVKDVTSDALIISIEKENELLGKKIYCEITADKGFTILKTDTIKVYGPFSMPVDEVLSDSGKYTLIGKVSDGILEKGEKVSIIRNGKVIAIGTAEDLQMFGKSLDETAKGDNVGIVFEKEKGVRPVSGDIVVKYQPSHVIDTSDVVN